MGGSCFHVTHRCQERRFLLRFEIDRRRYVARLREGARKYGVSVLDYVVTSNHVHLLLWADRAQRISGMMRWLQGTAGREINRRKGREGAFWRDRYHPALIQGGAHLSRCLFYLGLNMVRAGVVDHPQEWACCGYHELVGARRRQPVLDRDRLLRCLGMTGAAAEFVAWYQATLADKLSRARLAREPIWSECAAVGDRAWVEKLAGRITGGRKEVELVRLEEAPGRDRMDEAPASYGLKLSSRLGRFVAAKAALVENRINAVINSCRRA
jgi:putative transposase